MTKQITTTLSAEQKAALEALTPQEQGFVRKMLPRLGMYSQDKFEGKGKNAVLVKEAGMFYTEKETEEKDAEGKKVWVKEEVGTVIEGIVMFHRKQLSYYDEATEKYTSSPVYDSNDDVIPLFLDKKEIARGTPAELKSKYAYVDKKDNKVKSDLEENRILYILKDGETYQMNLRGSSMWAFSTYAKSVLVSACLTRFTSEPKEKGEIQWNQMSFDAVRDLTPEEASEVIAKVQEIVTGIEDEKAYYASLKTNTISLPTETKDISEDFKLPPVKNDF